MRKVFGSLVLLGVVGLTVDIGSAQESPPAPHRAFLVLQAADPHLCDDLKHNSAFEIEFNGELVLQVPITGVPVASPKLTKATTKMWTTLVKPLQALLVEYCKTPPPSSPPIE